MKNSDRALEDFEKLSPFDYLTGQRLINLGLILYSHGKVERAMEVFDRAEEAMPDDEAISLIRGNYYFSKKEYSMAIEEYTKLLTLNPESIEAYGDRGIAYQSLGEAQKALADYNKAVELAPSNGWPYYNRGGLLYKLKQYRRALKDLEKAEELGYAVPEDLLLDCRRRAR